MASSKKNYRKNRNKKLRNIEVGEVKYKYLVYPRMVKIFKSKHIWCEFNRSTSEPVDTRMLTKFINSVEWE